MIPLTYEQKKSIGLFFLLNSLSPNCVYGKEQIKNLSFFPRDDIDILKQELDQVESLMNNYERCQQLFDEIALILMEIKEIRGSLKRGQDATLNDIELFGIKKFLLQINKLIPVYEQLIKLVNLPLISFFDTSRALDILDPEKRRIPGFYILDSYSIQLKKIRDQKRHYEVSLRQEHTVEKKEWLDQERKKQVLLEEEEEQRIRQEITQKLRKHNSMIFHNTNEVGKLDLLLQKVNLARKFHGVKPIVSDDNLKLYNIQNPYIHYILKEKGKSFTPISFSMGKGAAVITGANMGGKSVTLKTIALNIVLAQLGFFVFGEKAEIPLFDYICIAAEEFQSVQNGLSSFGGEIVELQKSIQCLTMGFGFMLFDELARGTNPDEGARIVQAVVKFLNTCDGMMVFATHYDHVAEYADYHYQIMGLKNVDMKQLKEEVNLSPEKKGVEIISKFMNYGIYKVEGKSDCPRDAITICELLGLDDRVMKLMNDVS